jgi:hypothetical protein
MGRAPVRDRLPSHMISDIGKAALVLTHFEHKLVPC